MTDPDSDWSDPAEPAPITRPVTTRRAYQPDTTQRELPHSPEAEAHVLGCCLYGECELLSESSELGLRADHFYSPANRLIFQTLASLPQPGLMTLIQALRDQKQLDAVGGLPYLMSLSVDGTWQAKAMIATVRDKALLRDAIKAATATIEQAYSLTGPVAEFLSASREAMPDADSTRPLPKPRPISSYAYPAEDDPSILLGRDDYLGRGGGLLFISHAGAGKSSWIMDACMMWSLGRAWMGIKTGAKQRCLIIQAEDSDRYIGKIFSSFAHANKLSAEDLKLLESNCVIVRLKGVSGPAFFSALKRLTDLHEPDLVVINPIYLYAEGDIGRSEFAQPFLVGLDRVNVDEKWAYILIHHTGKPQAKDKSGKRSEVEDWESVYMGFGSSYLANWPRCSALLEPVSGKPGHYQIKLGKGGMNAGITKTVPQGVGVREEPVTRIAIRHSQEKMMVGTQEKPVYYWEMDTDSAESTPQAEVKGGRPRKYSFSQFASLFSNNPTMAQTVKVSFRMASEISGIKETAWRDLLMEATENGNLIRTSTANGFLYHLPA